VPYRKHTLTINHIFLKNGWHVLAFAVSERYSLTVDLEMNDSRIHRTPTGRKRLFYGLRNGDWSRETFKVNAVDVHNVASCQKNSDVHKEYRSHDMSASQR
jgi:hypothetical protein